MRPWDSVRPRRGRDGWPDHQPRPQTGPGAESLRISGFSSDLPGHSLLIREVATCAHAPAARGKTRGQPGRATRSAEFSRGRAGTARGGRGRYPGPARGAAAIWVSSGFCPESAATSKWARRSARASRTACARRSGDVNPWRLTILLAGPCDRGNPCRRNGGRRGEARGRWDGENSVAASMGGNFGFMADPRSSDRKAGPAARLSPVRRPARCANSPNFRNFQRISGPHHEFAPARRCVTMRHFRALCALRPNPCVRTPFRPPPAPLARFARVK